MAASADYPHRIIGPSNQLNFSSYNLLTCFCTTIRSENKLFDYSDSREIRGRKDGIFHCVKTVIVIRISLRCIKMLETIV